MCPLLRENIRGRKCVYVSAATKSVAPAAREERRDGLRDAGDRHGLEPDAAGAGQRSIEQTFAAEQLVLEAGNLLNGRWSTVVSKPATLPVSTMSF